MSVFLHIGPPKTATTSLQNSVIPRLGLPFEIKPDWARRLAREPQIDLKARTETDLIVSDEVLGDFTCLPPETVAARLARVFARATVVFCVRNPLDQFYSLYRQRLINSLSLQAREACELVNPASPQEYLNAQWRDHRERGLGFFASVDVERVRAAFGRYFDFETVDFGLLAKGSRSFALAFASACGVAAGLDMTLDNVTSIAQLEALLSQLPAAAPPEMRDLYRTFFTARLPLDQESFLASGLMESATPYKSMVSGA